MQQNPSTTEELKKRLDALLLKMHVKCKEIAPHFEQLGKLREEAAIIYEELHKRGEVPAYEPPALKDIAAGKI